MEAAFALGAALWPGALERAPVAAGVHNRPVRAPGPQFGAVAKPGETARSVGSVPGQAAIALLDARDDDLVAAVPAHDSQAQAALATLYDRYSAAVYGLALRMLGDAGLAEDVLQETFWRVWQHAASYEPGRVRFGTWLFRIATNLAIGEIRRASRRPKTAPPAPAEDLTQMDPLAALPDPDPEVPDQVWLAEQRRAVQAGLGTLPAEQRQALELAYFGGLSHSEIAAMQAAPMSTVKTRLALGLRKLAAFLRERRMTGLEDTSGEKMGETP